MVKLSVRNVIGDSNERSTPLQIDSDDRAQPPRVQTLQAVSLTPEAYAPATFRVTGEVQGAQFCVWDTDEGRPLEAQSDGAGTKERLVTFTRPGNYVVKLAAFGDNGGQDQKSVSVNVLGCPSGSVTAVLTVAEEAVCVDRRPRTQTVGASFRPDCKDDVCEFTRSVAASPRMRIADVNVVAPKGKKMSMQDRKTLKLDPEALGLKHVRNLVLEKDADGKGLKLKGELVRAKKNGPLPGVSLVVELLEEQSKPATQRAVPVTARLALPGAAALPLPPLPAGWEKPNRKYKFELRDHSGTIWQEAGLPQNKVVAVGGKRYLLTASPAGDRVQVSLSDAPPGAVPSAN
jgi:PKD repeat protein